MQTRAFKLYPTVAQVKILDRWLGVCCWVYNRALEQRIKSYRRRKEPQSLIGQQLQLTRWRSRIPRLRECPAQFERDALRRVDRGMKAFFRRCKAGQAPGFPRFRSRDRYNSMEQLQPGKFYRGNTIYVPGLGHVRARGRALPPGPQKALRIIRKASGWYAQILVETKPTLVAGPGQVGIDVGLQHFATLSDGTHVPNPRYGQLSAGRLRALQRRVSRRTKGSTRRRQAVKALQRQHERIADQRRSFAHQLSTQLVRQNRLIAVEKLNLRGLTRSRLGKNILDAAWGLFLNLLKLKAEEAGAKVVEVDPRHTSQECPACGNVKPKKLSERWHTCGCGLSCQRDHAASQVILARAVAMVAANRPSTDSTAVKQPVAAKQVGRKKRVVVSSRV